MIIATKLEEKVVNLNGLRSTNQKKGLMRTGSNFSSNRSHSYVFKRKGKQREEENVNN
jgi:hypothetical protein